MPYKNRIRMLEESYRLVESQLEQLTKVDKSDSTKILSLTETKNKYLSELKIMRKAQWENDHETIDYEDDR